MAKITLKQIKAELERFTSLSEKKAYLENLLKIVKSEKLLTKIKKLAEELEKHIEHGKDLEKKAAKLGDRETTTLEQKISQTSRPELSFSVSAPAPIAAGGTEAATPSYVPKYLQQKARPSALEQKAGSAQPIVLPREPGEFVRVSYNTAKEVINDLRTYFTRVLGLDMSIVPKSDVIRNEIEEHVKKVFNLGEGYEDIKRAKDYINWLLGKEEKEQIKYKKV